MKKTPNCKRAENKFKKITIQKKSLANRLAHLRSELSDNVERLTKTELNSAEKLIQINTLRQDVVDRDRHISELLSKLQADADEKATQVAQLRQEIVDRDRHIAAMTAEGMAKSLSLDQHRNLALQLGYRLHLIRQSGLWKLLKSLGALQQICSRKLKVEALPLHDLTVCGSGWESVGPDPQFLLVTPRAWSGLTGWYYLEFAVETQRPLLPELYFFEEGRGFYPANVIRFRLNGSGSFQIPLYVPFGCQAVRFDPHNGPTTFKLLRMELLPLDDPPELSGEFLEQATVFEALGFMEGNVSGLIPYNQIERHDGTDFCWRSVGEDPWFVLKGMQGRLAPGWYQISLRIRSNLAQGNASIYFDFGQGYSQEHSVHVPFGSDATVSRLFFLPHTPQNIRLDPFDCSARFSIKKIEFAARDAASAQLEICRRLSGHYEEFRDQDAGAIIKKLKEVAKTREQDLLFVLQQYYNSTFSLMGMTDAVTYADWIARNEGRLNGGQGGLIDWRMFEIQPYFSIVMPVYDVPEKYLRKTIESVLNQSYTNWELCIADDASPGKHIRSVLEQFAANDKRIKVTFRDKNGHISAASNSALELATGDYIALLDHDDELAPDALFWVVEALNRNPSARLLYSDEDKIDEEGQRSDPHFKSAWNHDMFLSQNYISHLGVFHRELILAVGGFRLGVEGSQDQDLLLRCLPYLNPDEIVHIPKVLYHWRIVQGSTAKAAQEKDYTADAGIKALQDYFVAEGVEGVLVEKGLAPNTYRIRHLIPETGPLVSLLIPTRDGVDLLAACIRSIISKTTYENFEILIIDNRSVQPETLNFFETITAEEPRVRVISYDHPFNYSAINNYGVKKANGEIVGLVNNDIEVISPEWLEEMVSHVLRPEIGCVGAKLYYEDDTIQHAGVIVGLGGVAGHSHKHYSRMKSGYFHRLKIVQNVSAVTAACLIVRKSVYEEVGGLDEENLQVAFNDVDFCLKVRMAGYRNLWTPYAELYHYESKTRGEDDTPEKVKRFMLEVSYMQKKWKKLLENDSYYSPNLTLAREDFSLR